MATRPLSDERNIHVRNPDDPYYQHRIFKMMDVPPPNQMNSPHFYQYKNSLPLSQADRRTARFDERVPEGFANYYVTRSLSKDK